MASIDNAITPKRNAKMTTADAIRNEAHSWVVEAIQRRRSLGAKRAVAQVAALYRMKERRVVMYLRNQVNRPPADEYLTMKERRRAELEDWLRRADAEAAELRALLTDCNDQ